MNRVICWLLGHQWLAQGWMSSRVDPAIPGDVMRYYWKCARCEYKAHTEESLESFERNYTDYKERILPLPIPNGGKELTF